jgi:hypothetical protein
LSKDGSFDEADGYPVSSCDDVVRVDDELIVAFERGIIVYDVEDADTDPSDPGVLSSYSVPAKLGGAVLLATLDEPGYPKMVFGSAQPQGVTFFELVDADSNDKTDSILNLGTQDTGGRCYVQSVVPSSTTPSGKAWLLAVNNRDESTLFAGSYNSGFRLFQLTATGGHVNPGVYADVQPLSIYAVQAAPQSGCETGEMGTFFDGLVGFPSGGGNEFSIWLTYGPRDLLNEKQVGLATFKGTYIASGPRVSIQFIGKTPIPTTCSLTDGGVARLSRGSDGRLYAAFGCTGIAVFSPQVPGTEAVLDSYWDGTSSGRIALQARLDAGNRVFVTFLNDRLAAFDSANLSPGPLASGWVDTEYQPNAIWPAPSSLSGKPAFWLADGMGGILRVQYLIAP